MKGLRKTPVISTGNYIIKLWRCTTHNKNIRPRAGCGVTSHTLTRLVDQDKKRAESFSALYFALVCPPHLLFFMLISFVPPLHTSAHFFPRPITAHCVRLRLFMPYPVFSRWAWLFHRFFLRPDYNCSFEKLAYPADDGPSFFLLRFKDCHCLAVFFTSACILPPE